jgi:hypothetical protein
MNENRKTSRQAVRMSDGKRGTRRNIVREFAM